MLLAASISTPESGSSGWRVVATGDSTVCMGLSLAKSRPAVPGQPDRRVGKGDFMPKPYGGLPRLSTDFDPEPAPAVHVQCDHHEARDHEQGSNRDQCDGERVEPGSNRQRRPGAGSATVTRVGLLPFVGSAGTVTQTPGV